MKKGICLETFPHFPLLCLESRYKIDISKNYFETAKPPPKKALFLSKICLKLLSVSHSRSECNASFLLERFNFSNSLFNLELREEEGKELISELRREEEDLETKTSSKNFGE